MKVIYMYYHIYTIDISFPFSVRSTSWHPSQHVLVVAITGPDASLLIYSADRPS